MPIGLSLSSGWTYLAIFLLGIGIGAYPVHLFYDAKIEARNAMDAKEARQIAEASLKAHRDAVQRQNALEVQHAKELKNAQRKTADIATKLAAGSLELRVRANCLQDTSSDSGAATDGTARLTQSAGRGYNALRGGVDVVMPNLKLCIKQLEDDRR